MKANLENFRTMKILRTIFIFRSLCGANKNIWFGVQMAVRPPILEAFCGFSINFRLSASIFPQNTEASPWTL